MKLTYVYGDIVKSDHDIVVNAANGIGWMGGFLTRHFKFKGVSESINYATKGMAAREMHKNYKIRKPGSVYFTQGHGVGKIGIIHAVTMLLPGTRSSEDTIRKLVPEIVRLAEETGAKSIALPYLGAGTGGLKKERVKNIYEDYFINYSGEIKVYVFDFKKD